MKTKLIAFFITFLVLAVQMVDAKPKVLLRLNLEKGTNYEMTMVSDNIIDQEMMGQKMKILQKMEIVTSYKILDVLPDKNFLIEYSMQSMKIDMDVNGQHMVMDSKSTDENPANQAMKDMTALKLTITVNSQGKVQKVEGLEDYASKITGNQQLAQAMQMFKDENTFKTTFEQTFCLFPEDKVEVGSKWNNAMKLPSLMNMDMVMNYEVADILDDQVVLNVLADINTDSPIEANGMKMNLKMTGTQSGTMKIDRKGGLAGTADLNQKFDMLMKMQNPQSGEDMEIPMQMNSVTKTTIVKI